MIPTRTSVTPFDTPLHERVIDDGCIPALVLIVIFVMHHPGGHEQPPHFLVRGIEGRVGECVPSHEYDGGVSALLVEESTLAAIALAQQAARAVPTNGISHLAAGNEPNPASGIDMGRFALRIEPEDNHDHVRAAVGGSVVVDATKCVSAAEVFPMGEPFSAFALFLRHPRDQSRAFEPRKKRSVVSGPWRADASVCCGR